MFLFFLSISLFGTASALDKYSGTETLSQKKGIRGRSERLAQCHVTHCCVNIEVRRSEIGYGFVQKPYIAGRRIL